jgi:hypothetical protein
MQINRYHYITFELLLILLYFIDLDGVDYKHIILNIFATLIGAILMFLIAIRKYEPLILINLLKLLRSVLVAVALSAKLEIS